MSIVTTHLALIEWTLKLFFESALKEMSSELTPQIKLNIPQWFLMHFWNTHSPCIDRVNAGINSEPWETKSFSFMRQSLWI